MNDMNHTLLAQKAKGKHLIYRA